MIFAVINLRGVSTNKTIIYFIAMQTYKELIKTKLLREIARNAFQKFQHQSIPPAHGSM